MNFTETKRRSHTIHTAISDETNKHMRMFVSMRALNRLFTPIETQIRARIFERELFMIYQIVRKQQ